MIRIAICDDDPLQLQFLRTLLEEYLHERKLVSMVQEFNSAQGLLRELFTHNFDIYLLDVLMPEINGIDLGEQIRKTDRDGIVIYLTSSSDHALDSYRVRAFYYMLKPSKKDALLAILDEAVSMHQKRKASHITVKTHDGTVRLLLDDILYAEYIGRTACYYLKDGSRQISTTLQSSFQETMQPLLKDNRFYLCGVSYVVNLYYIRSIEKQEIRLENAVQLQIPKRSYNGLHAAWTDYWLEGKNV